MKLQVGILIAVLLVVIACLVPAFADVAVREEIVGPPYEQGVSYILSPKGLHLATVKGE